MHSSLGLVLETIMCISFVLTSGFCLQMNCLITLILLEILIQKCWYQKRFLMAEAPLQTPAVVSGYHFKSTLRVYLYM